MTCNWLELTSKKVLMSALRFTLVMFPALSCSRAAHSSSVWNGTMTVWSPLFLALFIACFVQGCRGFLSSVARNRLFIQKSTVVTESRLKRTGRLAHRRAAGAQRQGG
jgi:hypothetical protein